MRIEDALKYEVAASWWASWFSNKWLQLMAARYFAWKTNRKWRRYARYCEPGKAAYLMIESGITPQRKCSKNEPEISTKTL